MGSKDESIDDASGGIKHEQRSYASIRDYHISTLVDGDCRTRERDLTYHSRAVCRGYRIERERVMNSK